jgi:CDP-L-myo-inositol myo-inositolphosphotransferase
MIKQAVIIAAGAGSRLNGHSHLPKPLVPVAGVGLLKRTILTAGRAGIDRFVIVTGHRSDEIRQAIDRDSQITAEVQWVFNPDWERGNGLSVLAARPHLGGESFVLSMSDHLFDPGVFVVMQNTTLGNGECALGVDYRVDDVFDLDDATKVRVDSGKIEAIGKTMTEFNAIDTGVFSCSPALFGALEAAVERGQDSLSAGIQQLAADGRMRTTDIGDLFWSDVDTPEAHAHAENALISSLGKPTDGFVSKHFNRKISTRISRELVKTPITPNYISLITMCVSFLAAYMVADPTYVSLAVGGLLFQFASIIDGCDGEVAKLKFLGSNLGEWVDTIADNVSYLVFFVAVVLGMYRYTGDPNVLTLSGFVIISLVVALSLVFVYLRLSGSGSLVSFHVTFLEEVPEERRGWFHRMSQRLKFASRRDFFAAVFATLALVNARELMFWSFTVSASLITLSILVFTGHLMRSRGFWPSRSASTGDTELISEKAD